MLISVVTLRKKVHIFHEDLVNLFTCVEGSDNKIDTFVEIQKGLRVGPKCKNIERIMFAKGI